MGYEIERFVSEINETLMCGLCFKVLENPKILTTCKHILCFSCIEKNVINENHCPLDQTHINAIDVDDPPGEILEYLSVLKIRCDFQEYGCKEVVLLSRLLLHRLNCDFHPERKVKCNDCGLESEKTRFRDHSCVQTSKNRLNAMNEQMLEMNRFYGKEILTLKTQIQRLDRDMDCFRRLYARECSNTGAERQMVSFSCITDTQSGNHEMIFIQTINLTLQCEANILTKVGQIKYNASSIANLNTTDFSLFYNGLKLEDHHYMSYYNIHNGSICHLLPNQSFITFDCVDIKQIIGFSVRTSDTIKAIIGQLHTHIKKLIPEQLFLYIQQCSCTLYYKDIKLEETYEFSNYDVLSIKILKYCNRLPIDI